MALHSQRRNRDVRRSSGGFLAVWGRVLASLGMVMTALVGVTVATQSAVSAAPFSSNFMNVDGNIRYTPSPLVNPTNQFGWANSGVGLPNSCPGGVANPVSVAGTNGLYNCGAPDPAN